MAISLTRAGISRSAKALHVQLGGRERSLMADIECSVDLGASQKGVHMSRFEEVGNAAIEELTAGEALRIDVLAARIAATILERQSAKRAHVTIRATYPMTRLTPISEVATQEMYGLLAMAVATAAGTRRVTGVSAQGMNACPCAQDLLREQAATALGEDGFDGGQVDRILSLVPIATHNQRAEGTLCIGTPDGRDIDPDLLIEIVEEGMSSEIYELMKRTDERYVVDRAHRRPRFVEDSAREMIRGVLEHFPELPDDAVVSATQVNFETIHTHNVEAARTGTIGQIRAELRGAHSGAPHLTLARWLDGE